jgi:hypothetical protein
MDISRELFDQQRRPRFGTVNPERMHFAFWEWMIRGGDPQPRLDEGLFGRIGMMIRNDVLKSGYGPWRARDLFNIPLNREDGPIWTFDRMGATHTELPDGRVVAVGGEHEDDYDPDFRIYNDVVVFGPDDRIDIYGYPKEAFPPTDFHTASLVGDRIILIGCLGNPDDRRYGHTPVYSLDSSGFQIRKIETSGEPPGWIHQHEAGMDAEGRIIIRGGLVLQEHGDRERCRRNVEEYALDVRSWSWHRLTNRNWRQFLIFQEDRDWFGGDQCPGVDTLLPQGVEHVIEWSENVNRIRAIVAGIPLSLALEFLRDLEVIIESDLPDKIAMRMVEEIRAKAEAAIQRRCVVEEV